MCAFQGIVRSLMVETFLIQQYDVRLTSFVFRMTAFAFGLTDISDASMESFLLPDIGSDLLVTIQA